MFRIFICITILIISSCQNEKKTSFLLDIEKKDDFVPIKEVKSSFANSRSTWQKPDLILDKLQPLVGKVVADIGAGTGYFTYRIAFKEADVIAIDVDRDMINLMNGYIENLPKEIADNIYPRLVQPDNPGLKPAEADIAIIINTISYIDNRVAYLKKLKIGMKSGGKLMIVDYKTRDLNIPAPPMSERMAIGILQASLREAGFTKITVDDSSLDYQYIIEARS